MLVILFVCGAASLAQAPQSTLTGLAVLPADTKAEGPPSGAWLNTEAPGVAQFASQPVQGVSALWPAGGNEWWALSDNGFGARANSSDYLLRIYRVAVNWGKDDQPGAATVQAYISLADPDRKLPFPITRELTKERWLTGADLDPESMVRMTDGSFWIGDEFGPFLLHFAADGHLLEPPYEVEHMRSPDHPQLAVPDAGERSAATLRRSRGFEGLALFGDQLYAAVEAGAGPSEEAAIIYEFDLPSRLFTGQMWRVALTSNQHALTEFVSLAALGPECRSRLIAIERDPGHGAHAKLKRVLELQLAGNSVVASVIADLLDIADPLALGGHPGRFTFPFLTTEAVWPLSRDELVLANDNNFPAGGGRPGNERDPTEFIRLKLSAPLCGR